MTACVEVEVTGLRASVVVETVVDTGFDGDLCLPVDAGAPLGLELGGSEWAQ